MNAPEERVVVTRPFVGLIHMQVCAVADATDEEILEVCNRDNPSFTSAGWSYVHRNNTEHPNLNPGPCQDFPGRVHFLVGC